MARGRRTAGRGTWIAGLVIAGFTGLSLATAGQAVVPALARVPGVLLCGDGSLELVLRRRAPSYGRCASGAQVSFGALAGTSLLVWTALAAPPSVLFARWVARRASGAERSGPQREGRGRRGGRPAA